MLCFYQGKYAYIKSGNQQLGDKATLILKDFEVTKGSECLSLKYHMYGQDIEILEVRKDNVFLLKLKGPQGTEWKEAKGRIPISGPPGQPGKTTVSLI